MSDLNAKRIGRGFAVAASLAAAVVVLGGRPAWAWGRDGHRASAALAEARLNPAAKAAVRDLLEPGESLADASTWADEVRRDRPESAPWHYVNVPLTAPRYADTFCPEEGCVVRKIGDFRRVLADRTAPRRDRQEALRFLAHFVQDLHQPVHVGERNDRGGNDLQLQFFDEGSNLHRVWDSGLLARQYDDEAKLARALAELATPERASQWASGTEVDWANESLEAARGAYRRPKTGEPLKPGDKLGQDYTERNLPVARLRLAQSGVRLAAVLNAVLGPDKPLDR